MTLVQVLADENTINIACDFRLTDPWSKVTRTNSAYKLVNVSLKNGSALVGVTGISEVDGIPVGDWIARRIEGWLSGVAIEEYLDSLRQAERSLATLQGAQDRRLSFIVGTFVGSQALIAIVSNFEKFVDGRVQREDSAESTMTVSSIKPKSPAYYAFGSSGCIKNSERDEMTVALRSRASDQAIQERLRDLNIAVSARSKIVNAGRGLVSGGCHIGTLHSTGLGSTTPYLTDEQSGDFIPPDAKLMFDQMGGLPFGRKIGPDGKGMPIRMTGQSSARMGGTEEYFREQLKLQPDSAEVWNNYGGLLASRRRNTDAIVAYDKALALNPSYATAAANLADQVWKHQGDTERAKQLYEDAVSSSEPNVPSWMLANYAIFCHEGAGDLDLAEGLYERASQDKNNPVASAQRALYILSQKGDLSIAEELLSFALSAKPNNPLILRLAAFADYFHFGRPEAARDKIHKACSHDPNNVDCLRLGADLCLTMGDPASAAYYYGRLMKRQDYNATVHGNYGLALMMMKKVDGAMRHLVKASRRDPDSLAIRTNLAAVTWVTGKHAEASSMMQDLLHSDPPPEIELEVTAMLYLAAQTSRSKTILRLRPLIEDGIRTDGNTLRCMSMRASGDAPVIGPQLADIIEGKIAIPQEW